MRGRGGRGGHNDESAIGHAGKFTGLSRAWAGSRLTLRPLLDCPYMAVAEWIVGCVRCVES